jgi:Flp pilus assembly protein TadG
MSASAAPRRPATRRIWSRRGSASLEFAVAAPVLLILLGGGIDLGLLLRVQIVIASGLTNAVQYANVQGVATTATDLQSVMQSATGLNGITASVAGPDYYCPSSYPVTLTRLTSGTTCSGATAPANKYVVITASYPYVPMMPGLSHIIATTVVQTATAMVQ